MGWCPGESHSDKSKHSFSYVVDDPDYFFVWMREKVDFPRLDDQKFYSNIEQKLPIEYPNTAATLFKISDFLKIANVNYEEVKTTGAIINIIAQWQCDIDDDICYPQIMAQRLDTNEGFNYSVYEYYRAEDGTLHRWQNHHYGIKFLV